MNKKKVFTAIDFDIYAATPKYLQLVQSIIKAIAEGKIEKNTALPSINEMSYEYDISRDTVEKGYRYLKKSGILGSVPGKGYYVKSANVKTDLKIFLLFNKLSTHKKIIYDSFVKKLGNNAVIDFYIYNNDFNFFKKLITSADKNYTHFVIITHFMDRDEDAFEILNTIPKEKLILLDKLVPGVTGNFSAVYENFEDDIYGALQGAITRLKNYRELKIIFPEDSYFPDEIANGFKKFCRNFNFPHSVVPDIAVKNLKKGEAYICLREDDLVMLVEKLVASKLKVGKDVGVISYNETPLKKIILKGITTISTDFEKMGAETAKLILNKEMKHLQIPFYLKLRPSL